MNQLATWRETQRPDEVVVGLIESRIFARWNCSYAGSDVERRMNVHQRPSTRYAVASMSWFRKEGGTVSPTGGVKAIQFIQLLRLSNCLTIWVTMHSGFESYGNGGVGRSPANGS